MIEKLISVKFSLPKIAKEMKFCNDSSNLHKDCYYFDYIYLSFDGVSKGG